MLVAIGATLLVAAVARPAAAQDNPFSNCHVRNSVVTMGSLPELIPERPNARRVTLTGSSSNPVVVTCDDTLLQAQTIVWEDDTKHIEATGEVLLDQGDLRVYAAHASMNGETKLGTFYDATGMARIASKPADRSQFGTMEPDVIFYGEEISKIGPKTYKLKHGGFTTCVQPTPRWEMTGSTGTVTLDKHAVMKNVVLSVKDVPLMYLPAIYYPIDKEDRSTGFLLPTYGSSTVRGTSISNAFFWAISRSQDATFYHDWYTKAGQGVGTDYRYVSAPGSQGDVKFYLLDQNSDPTLSTQAQRSYSIDGSMNQAMARGFRVVGSVNYFDSVATQQNYQDISSFSQRSRNFNVQLTGGLGRYRLTAQIARQDFFVDADNSSRYGEAPLFHLDVGDKAIGHSKVYFGAWGESLFRLQQSDNADPTTNRDFERVDTGARLRSPLSSLSYSLGHGFAQLALHTLVRFNRSGYAGAGFNAAQQAALRRTTRSHWTDVLAGVPDAEQPVRPARQTRDRTVVQHRSHVQFRSARPRARR